MLKEDARVQQTPLLVIGGGIIIVLASVGAYAVATVSEDFARMLVISYGVAVALLAASVLAMRHLLPRDRRFLALAAGVPAAQVISLLMSVVAFGPDAVPQVAPDLTALVVGLVWLFQRPGRAPLLFLLGYQAFALALKTYILFTQDFTLSFIRGVITTILVQILALFVLYDAYLKTKARTPRV
ncbi:hypothetical protein KKP04_11050 [Rhodomicrobium sp. Az07]|uniref:hypothetical protein n=1 Tax=Rhodomicrobium sp. Az07 TaxID=2839034 RepID=UPI001BE86004|nr:hypothetical protein [Rhodomicrobium sp. Az07]MBT3071400.1 hypothetical protein [Rhodomicrobium sp. Az07]